MLQSDRLLIFYLGSSQNWLIYKGFCFSSFRPVLHPHPPPNMHAHPHPSIRSVHLTNGDNTVHPAERTLIFHFYRFYFFSLVLSVWVCFAEKLTKTILLHEDPLSPRGLVHITKRVFPKDSRSRVGTRITEREKQSFSRPHIFFLRFQTVIMLQRENKSLFFSSWTKPNLVSRTSPAVWKEHVHHLTLKAAAFNYQRTTGYVLDFPNC